MFTYPHGFMKSSDSAFVPTDVSGLLLWLDATDLTTLWQESTRSTQVASVNDPVGAWDDKSGLGNHWVQATSGDRPLYKEDFNTSYAGIYFDGIASTGINGSMSETANDWTIFAVCRSEATPGWIIDFQTGRFGLGNNGAQFGFYDGAWATSGTNPTTPSIVTFQADSTDATSGVININRTEVVAADYTQFALGGSMAIGSRYDGGSAQEWTGHIASFLLYTGNLSAADIISVEDYLASQYGITL